MAKPTDTYDWATSVGTTEEPPTDMKAAGFVQGQRPPAKWHNWLWNGASKWHAYTQNLHNEPEFLNRAYAWTGVHLFAAAVQLFGAQNELEYADAGGASAPRLRTVMLEPCGLNGWDPRVQGYGGAQSQPSSENPVGWGKIALPVPSGGRIVRVRVGYERKAVGDDADLYVRKTTDTKTVPFTAFSSTKLIERTTSGTGQQVVDLGPIDDAIDTSTSTYALEISPSGDRTQPLPDIVHWIELQFLDPGPRNF